MMILLALAFAGVSGLAFMAHRYGKILEQRAATSDRRDSRTSSRVKWTRSGQAGPRASVESAAGLVHGFIVVRRAVRERIDQLDGRLPRTQDVVAARDGALAESGMSAETYAEVRRVYRAWRDGRGRTGTPMADAFEARRNDLERLDLGDYELLD
jgi:hypothetical protein